MRAGGQAQPLGRVRFERKPSHGGGTDGRDAPQAYRVLRRTRMETSSLASRRGRRRRRFFPRATGGSRCTARRVLSSLRPVRRRRALECSRRQRQPFQAVALAVNIYTSKYIILEYYIIKKD